MYRGFRHKTFYNTCCFHEVRATFMVYITFMMWQKLFILVSTFTTLPRFTCFECLCHNATVEAFT